MIKTRTQKRYSAKKEAASYVVYDNVEKRAVKRYGGLDAKAKAVKCRDLKNALEGQE